MRGAGCCWARRQHGADGGRRQAAPVLGAVVVARDRRDRRGAGRAQRGQRAGGARRARRRAIQRDSPLARARGPRMEGSRRTLQRDRARARRAANALRPESFDPPSAMITAARRGARRPAGARRPTPPRRCRRVRDALIARTDLDGIALARRRIRRSCARRAARRCVRRPSSKMRCSPPSNPGSRGRSTGTPRERLRALFGGDLPGVVTFTPRDPAALVTAHLHRRRRACSAATRLRRARGWTPSAGTIRRPRALAEVLLRKEIAGDPVGAVADRAGAVDRRRSVDRHIVHRASGRHAGRTALGADRMRQPGSTPRSPSAGCSSMRGRRPFPRRTRHRDGAALQQRQHACAAGDSPGGQPGPAQPWTHDHARRGAERDAHARRACACSRPRRSARAASCRSRGSGQRPGNTGISFSL